jgi:predicted alpha/beta hydrolase
MQRIRVRAGDGAEADLSLTAVPGAHFGLLWLPALGVTARHYRGFAEALAAAGVSVAVHEWRGAGSSSLRASRQCDWGYRELLERDIPASLKYAQTA